MPKNVSEQIVSRRSFLRAAARSVPAVAVAVATPALASSGEVQPAPPTQGFRPTIPCDGPVLEFSSFIWKWEQTRVNYARSNLNPAYALKVSTKPAVIMGPGGGDDALVPGQTTVQFVITVTGPDGALVYTQSYLCQTNQNKYYNVDEICEVIVPTSTTGLHTVTWELTSALDS